MKSLPAVIGLIIALASCVSCAKKPNLVGTWVSETTVQGVPSKSEDTFHADGRFVSTSRLGGVGAGTIVATDTGTWKLEGDDMLSIVLHDVDWKFEGGTPEAAAKARKRLEMNKQSILRGVNEQFPIKIKWNGPDEYSATANGKTDTYRRRK